MSGGLSHHTDEENGPSHTVGHELSKQQGCYSLERSQCVCADVIRVPANYKNKLTPLDMTDVVRDVETSRLQSLTPMGPILTATGYLTITLPVAMSSKFSRIFDRSVLARIAFNREIT